MPRRDKNFQPCRDCGALVPKPLKLCAQCKRWQAPKEKTALPAVPAPGPEPVRAIGSSWANYLLLTSGAAPPVDATAGDVFLRDDGRVFVSNGTEWIELAYSGSRAERVRNQFFGYSDTVIELRLGMVTFSTRESGLDFQPGDRVRLSVVGSSVWMEGMAVVCAPRYMQVNIDVIDGDAGSTWASWNVNLVGRPAMAAPAPRFESPKPVPCPVATPPNKLGRQIDLDEE